LVGGTFGGWLYQTFATTAKQPEIVFLVIGLVGVLAAILMWLYNKFFAVKEV
jgi:uncharacterized membrane protein YeaQ/YmgE (transglycosylase-associated protein family)